MSGLLSYVISPITYFLPSRTQSNAAKLQQRFGNNPAVNAIYNEYFSRYSKDLLPLDDEILNQIDRIAQRKAVGLEIGKQWKRIILGEQGLALDSTHREIPYEMLLRTALTAQFTFEKELTKLKKLDSLQMLRHGKVSSE